MAGESDVINFDDLLIGRKLGGCLIQSRLGKGGMATVYGAIRDGDEATVAIKVIAHDIAATGDFLKRFQREARLMASLDHPNILPVYNYGTFREISYIVMELLTGGSLGELLVRQRLETASALVLIEQIGSALDYAHQRGIVHRDLKPANVLLDAKGNAYLTDFGIAKWVEETTGLTLTGMVVGTPAYMSPEQWRTEPVDARTDVYAFGVMIFQMLTGQLPFVARTPFSLMYKHLDESPPSVTLFNVHLPSTVDLVMERALAKSQEDRYASAGDLVTSLKEVLVAEAPAVQGHTVDLVVEDERKEQTFLVSSNLTAERGYDSIDVGARTLLSRARETARETAGDAESLAQAVIRYVQELREQAKHRPVATASPYKALESYDVVDNRLFFGREMAIDAMLARAPFFKFTALHAESGAGKTSLIRAGLMPRLLAGGFLPLYVAVRRRPPHEALKHGLLADPGVAPGLARSSLHTYLKGVQRAVGSKREIFVFFDQFETFFTDVFSDDQRAEFVNELAECLDDASLKLRVTLALRTEYFGLLASFQPAIAQPFEKEFLLRRLTMEEAERAMVKPAQAQGYDYETGLVATILSDLADESNEIAPPQLQLVGTALIEGLPSYRKQITHRDYLDAGGAKGVLRGYLEGLLGRLPPQDRRPARVIIESLVRGDLTRDVRTAASLQAELNSLNVHVPNLQEILTTLRENHILRIIETDDGLAYELVHDYLALQIQLDPETVARKAAQELLDRRIQDYKQFGSLLTREELEVINVQVDRLYLTDEGRSLIARTERAYRRQRRFVQALITVALLGIIGVLVVGLLAVIRESQNRQDRLQDEQTARATLAAQKAETDRTESRRLAVLAEQQLSVDTMASLNLAIEAVTPRNRPYVPEAEFALSQAVQSITERLYLPSERKVNGAQWSADETQVLTWSLDGTARIFDTTSGTEQVYMSAVPGELVTGDWSPDETQVLVRDDKGRLYLFDAVTGERVLFIEDAPGYSDVAGKDGVSWQLTGERFIVWNDTITEIRDKSGEFIAQLPGTRPVWSADSQHILTIGNNDAVFVSEVTTGDSLVTLRGHVNTVNGASWSADGSHILTWSDDGRAIIWNSQTGDPEVTFDAGTGNATIMAAWSPDEQYVATVSSDGAVTVWNAGTNARIGQLIVETAPIRGVLWNRDGSQLLTYGSNVDTLAVWDIPTLTRLSPRIDMAAFSPTDVIEGAQWSPSEVYFLAYSRSGLIRVFDAQTAELIATLSGHTSDLTGISWSVDGTRILSSSTDGSARIWLVLANNIGVGRGEIQRLTSRDSEALIAVWNANETLIATADSNGTIHIWDMASGQESLFLAGGHVGRVKYLKWSWDERWLLSGGEDGLVIIWDVATGKPMHTLAHGGEIFSIYWNRDGTRILTGSDDGMIRVWGAVDGTELLRLQHSAPGIAVSQAVWNADETRILASSDDAIVQVWDTQTGMAILTIRTAGIVVYGVSWNRDESRILAWGYAGLLGGQPLARIYDAVTGAELLQFEAGHTDEITSASWSPDEKRILTTSRDETARIWDAQTGELLAILQGHTDNITDGTWSRSGSRVLTRSVDGQVRVWDATSGVEVLRLTGHHDRVNSALWNADETRILTASSDGTVRIWQAWPNVASLLDEALHLVTRPLSAEQRQAFFLSPVP